MQRLGGVLESVRRRLDQVGPWTYGAPLLLLLYGLLAGYELVAVPRLAVPRLTRLPAMPVVNGISVPAFIWANLLLIGLALMVSRMAASRARIGPIVIGEIVDATGAPSPHSGAVGAILRDRLARASAQPRGVMPSGGALAVGQDLPVTAPDAVGGVLARMGMDFWASSVRLRGWTVRATIRPKEGDHQVGLTVIVEHNLSHRLEFVRTLWACSESEAARVAAYHVAAWYLGRQTPPSTRDRPVWRPTPESLRSSEDADYFLYRRRFDEAIDAAKTGLGQDPTNLVVRRILGEAYERLGLFLMSLHVYTAGLVMLVDLDNSWHGGGPSGPAKGLRWPPRRSPIRSEEAAGLIWRYVAVLAFADNWVTRWVRDLARYEEQLRFQRRPPTRRPLGRAPAIRWTQPVRCSSFDETVRRLSAPEVQDERDSREGQGVRLRGFVGRRHDALLRTEFPLLRALWFVDTEERQRCLPLQARMADGRGNASVKGWLDHEQARFPLDGTTDRLRRKAARRPAAKNPGTVEEWVGELAWLFTEVQRAETARRPRPPVLPGRQTAPPQHAAGIATELRRRLGLSGDLGQVADALSDPDGWARLRLDRVLVGECATWAAHHLCRLHRAGAITLPEDSLHRLAALRAQLDVRLLMLRAALSEMDRILRNDEIDARGFAPDQLMHMLWLSCRFRYIDRLHALAGQSTRLPAETDERTTLGDRTCEIARDLTATPLRAGRRRASTWAQWNLHYYAACLHALAIRDREAEPVPAGDPDEVRRGWTRDNNGLAELAVRALNHSLQVRGQDDVTAIESGSLDWLLYEDPDLDQLRAHPQFQRWAASTFALPNTDLARTPAGIAARNRFDDLRRQTWNDEGVFGIEARWPRTQQLWWLANDHFLVTGLRRTAPAIASRWRRIAAVAAADGRDRAPEELAALVTEFLRRHEKDSNAWHRLASYHRFAARTDLRLATSRALAELAGDGELWLAFPASRELLTVHIHLNYQEISAALGPLITDSRRSAEAVGRRVRTGTTDVQVRHWLRDEALAAAVRWERLHHHVETLAVLRG